MRAQLAQQGRQISDQAGIMSDLNARITALTGELNDAGLSGVDGRTARVEAQVASFTGHQAQMAMQAAQARTQTRER